MLAKQIITYLERFADQIKRIVRTLKKEKFDKKVYGEIMKLLKSVSENYGAVMKIFYEKDKQSAFKAETTTRALLKDCDALMERYPNFLVARTIEYFRHSVGSMKGILRSIMEYE